MRLSFETLCNMTNLVRPKAQAKWFLLHLGVEVPCDRLGPILTEASYEKLLERKKVINKQQDLHKELEQDTGNYCEQEIIKSSISAPLFCGIYFLIFEGIIVYVGKSKNVLSRVGNHANTKHFDSFGYIQIPNDKLDKVERYYIKKFAPKLNIEHK